MRDFAQLHLGRPVRDFLMAVFRFLLPAVGKSCCALAITSVIVDVQGLLAPIAIQLTVLLLQIYCKSLLLCVLHKHVLIPGTS